MNILIVDCDGDCAPEIAGWLESGGYSMTVARTQGEALDMIVSHTVQVLILSEHPTIDMAQLLKSAARFERIPAIVLGNLNSSKCRVDALALGADCYLAKPYSPREVLARVRVLTRSMAKAL